MEFSLNGEGAEHTASEGVFFVHEADTLDGCFYMYFNEILTNIEMC